MNTIVFGNQKGGPGKSTLSVLFARWLAEKRAERVAFIDLDSQMNSSKSLRVFDGGIEALALFGVVPIDLNVDPSNRIVLFRGSKALIDLDRGRPEVVIPAFRRHIESLASQFDGCVIDTPPSLGLRLSAALIAADHVTCPIELEEYSIDGVTDMMRTIFGVRQKYNPALQLVGIVANRFNPHSVRQKEALARLIADYHQFVIPAKISTRSAIPEALAAGVPVWRLNKSAAREASAEVLEVFELLHARIESATSSSTTSLEAA